MKDQFSGLLEKNKENPVNVLRGLTAAEQAASRRLHGSNVIEGKEDKVLLHVLKEIVLEPMFICLAAACTVYFFAGQYREGVIMAFSILIVAGISLYQEYRSRNAVNALKKLSASKATVIREGKQYSIAVEEVVVDDIVLIAEGEIVPADGRLLTANDLSVNEAVLTGEAYPIIKQSGDHQEVYKGTLVASGSGALQVTAVGKNTKFGKIGTSLSEITVLKTPLQKQISRFVANMAWAGSVAFLFVVVMNYYRSGDLLLAFMQGLTLAMSILPEEIPVAFSTFMALGAFRLLRNNVIVKQPRYVETLGTATVICADKTGTLTMNAMNLSFVYDALSGQSIDVRKKELLLLPLVEYAMWASETDPFDPMEKSIHALYGSITPADKRPQFLQVHEYPLSGKPPMMTHIFRSAAGETIIACKGAPEALLARTDLPITEIKKIEAQSQEFAEKGFRILGVGKATWNGTEFPASQQDLSFELLGLLAFEDPPKENMAATMDSFRHAGIKVKMITGDYAETALAIASKISLPGSRQVMSGDEVLKMEEVTLRQRVNEVDIFARMYPEAKLKVVDALVANGEIVAMTGDGVNDAPALKAAHIGIAMGSRGTEVAKATASLVLVDDDLAHMVQAVEQGRKIYDNLKKAIQYIISIHIPIILVVTIPLLLGWAFTDIFTPVHVIFLELIMGPTCSIIYENEPVEPGTMFRPPRKASSSFLSGRQLSVSIVQGLMITLGCLGIGYYFIRQAYSHDAVRTVIFITLLFSNIFLTFINRSFHYSIFRTIRYKNKLLIGIAAAGLLCIVALLLLPFLRELFRLQQLSLRDVVACFIIAFAFTTWIELFKKRSGQ